MQFKGKITPEGTRDLLFDECKTIRKIENGLTTLFSKSGYNEVITPGVEFYDVFSGGSSFMPQENMYKLVDSKGRLLVLRPDSTTPIARMIGSKLRGYEMPLRLFYNQNIYSINPSLSGRQDEVLQTGVELVGADGFDADIEVIELAIEALKNCTKMGDFRIEIGHIGLFDALLDNLCINDELKETIRDCIESKNYASLNDILDTLSDKKVAVIIKQLPRLFGGEEVFEKAYKLFNNEKCKVILDYLKSIYISLNKLKLNGKIIVDLGVVNKNHYYSGIVFKGYIVGAGDAVLSGGRYDKLYPEFGMDLGAIGFAVNVDRVSVAYLKNNGEKTQKKPLRIALTKGRLEDKTIKLFEEVGINCDGIHSKGRKLIIPISNGEIEVVLAKSADVITYVEHGVCDIGVVGKDTIMELGRSFYEVLDLGFGKCRFVVAGRKGVDFYSGYNAKTIATKYPNIARKHFESKNMDVDIVKIEGSVELAPLLELADAIVDIVETGSTLKENGLEIVDEIAPVSARLIVNMVSIKLKKQEIEELVSKLESILKKE